MERNSKGVKSKFDNASSAVSVLADLVRLADSALVLVQVPDSNDLLRLL